MHNPKPIISLVLCMKKVLFLFTLLTIICLQPNFAYADREFLSLYTQTLFNAESGMDANDASSVIQTKDGYLWIASYSGLIRYDGNEFVRFNSDTESGFTASSATTFYEDLHGRLWIGTNESGLFYREGGNFVRISSKKPGEFASIRSITSDSKGNIYVGSGSGIGRLEGTEIIRISFPEIDSEFILGLICDKTDKLWGVTRNGALFTVSGNKINFYKSGTVAGSSPISLLLCKDGRILAGLIEGGVARLTESQGKLEAEPYKTEALDAINGLYEDNEGRIWACGDNGLGFFDKNHRFRTAEGALLNSSIEKIYQDYESNFWVASSRQGLLQITRNKFMDINFAAMLPANVVNSTMKWQGHLYIGTDNGLTILDSAWRQIETGLTKKLKGVRVRSLFTDSKNRLWISTYKDLGLILLDDKGGTKYFTKKNGLPEDKVRLVFELANGDIAVGTNGGAAIIRNDRVIKSITEKDGLSNKTILSISQGKNGTVFFGSDGGGIFALKDNLLMNFTKSDGLSSGVILRMLYDPSIEGIWISTGTKLNFLSKTGRIRKVILDTPIKNGIFDIKISPKGKLMLLADTGIYIIDQKQLLTPEQQQITSFMRKDGFASSITANSWSYMDKEGTLFVCGSNGVYSINVNRTYVNNVTPKIVINKAVADGRVILNPTSLTLPQDTKRLTLSMAVLSFTNPAYNKIAYKLKGFENKDTEGFLTKTNNVSYTNLSGGDYTFTFRAANSDGVPSSKPLTLNISKAKSWKEQPQALAAAAILTALAIFLITRLFYAGKNKALLKRQEELRAVTEQAMTAIANTIDAKDTYTKGHSTRVAKYAVKIAQKIGMDKNSADNLYYTALLHDIGKIGVPDNILNKPDKLTDEEYSIMKQHPTSGGNILKVISNISGIKDGAAYHHERYDGNGYNTGLKGEEIPLAARIICVADSVDAMGSTRPYRTCRSKEYVISELKKNAGTQFDPHIAEIFIKMLESGEIEIEKQD